MAKQGFSYIDQAYEELFGDVVRPQKNLYALISHLYLPPFIQVMEAFANHRPSNQEPTAYDSLEHKFEAMDIGSSSSGTKPSTWDEAAAASSSSTTSGWGTWPTPTQPQTRECIHHRFPEFDDPLEIPHSKRSSVVYPYVPINYRRNLDVNLFTAWHTSTLPSRMVRSVPRPDEALGISLALLAKKAKLYPSN